MLEIVLKEVINQIDKNAVRAVALVGSYARGTASAYSDVDILCVLREIDQEHPPSIQTIAGKYVVISYLTQEAVDATFHDPDQATCHMLGLRDMEILLDPEGYLQGIKQKARRFRWDNNMHQRAQQQAALLLVSWVEEVNKALQGYEKNQVGAMLNGLFGLTFGLFGVLRVQHGIMLEGENVFYDRIISYLGEDSSLSLQAEIAFGVKATNSLRQRVEAGLQLFCMVVEQLSLEPGSWEAELILSNYQRVKGHLDQGEGQ